MLARVLYWFVEDSMWACTLYMISESLLRPRSYNPTIVIHDIHCHVSFLYRSRILISTSVFHQKSHLKETMNRFFYCQSAKFLMTDIPLIMAWFLFMHMLCKLPKRVLTLIYVVMCIFQYAVTTGFLYCSGCTMNHEIFSYLDAVQRFCITRFLLSIMLKWAVWNSSFYFLIFSTWIDFFGSIISVSLPCKY